MLILLICENGLLLLSSTGNIRLDKNDLMNIIWMKKLYSNLSLQRKAVEPAAWQPEL